MQRLHEIGFQHDFGVSGLKRRGRDCLGQQRPGVGLQWFDKDHLGGLWRGGVPSAGSAEAFGVAHLQLVISFVDGSTEALRIHKGFQQQHGVPESRLPIGAKTPLA